MSIMTVKDLKKKAPKGEFLAYINKEEAAALKRAGGSGHLVNGIPSFVGSDYGDSGYQGGMRGDSGYQGSKGGDNIADNKSEQQKTDALNKQIEENRQQRQRDAIKAELAITPFNRNKVLNKFELYNNKYRQEQIQKAIRRNKYSNLKELDAIKQRARFGIFGTTLDAFNVPEEIDFFDTDSPREIAAQLSKLNSLTPTQSKSLGDLQKDIAMENTKNISQADFDIYNNRNRTITRGGNPNILPQYAMMGGGAGMGSEDVEEEEKTFDYRFGDPNTNQALDVTLGQYFNQGGRITRAGGGIMNAVPRQGYIFGGITKAIGKVAKAAGKVLSSDVGKMALAGAAFYYGGGGGNPFTAAGRAKFSAPSFFSRSNPLLFSANKAGEQVFNPLKFAGLTTAIGAMGGPAKVDQLPDNNGAQGGRLIDPLTGKEGTPASMRENIELAKLEAGDDPVKLDALNQAYNNMLFTNVPYAQYGTYAANGGRIGKAEGGLMNLGGMEKDYRAEGGFVPIGKQEKADDVPARLSVNEFVFTADAVRNAGQGDIDKGAEVMENMMKNLENGGTVSEESQGNTGAQNMFSVSERIGEVI